MKQRRSAFLVSHGLLALLLQASLPTAALANEVERFVPFLTVRNPVDVEGPGLFFGDERGELRAGHCVLQEPDLGGIDPTLDAVRAILREQFLRVDRVDSLDPGDVLDEFASIEGSLAPALYVHGYLIDFEKGCRRAALLQENAGLSGRFLWFSWPSDGDIANYPRDEADLYWSVPDLANVIIELDQRSSPGTRIDILGHSLGARGVVLALHELAHRHPDIRLGNVVLIAADVDFEIFARRLSHIGQIAERITVYVSDEDRPLALSAQLHGYSRLGQSANDISALSEVDFIDVSGVPNETPSGHLYHIHNSRVGSDLGHLLVDELSPAQRPGLERTGPNSWAVQN